VKEDWEHQFVLITPENGLRSIFHEFGSKIIKTLQQKKSFFCCVQDSEI